MQKKPRQTPDNTSTKPRDPLLTNKIIAGFVTAFLVMLVLGKLISSVYHAPELAENAISVDTSQLQTVSSATADDETFETIAAYLADASPERGAQAFRVCAACHTVTKDGANLVGPNLWNIVNRKPAILNDFKYSKALQQYQDDGSNWSFLELGRFIRAPNTFIAGEKTNMTFAGIKNAKKRADLISYLRLQADNPIPIPDDLAAE